MKVKLTTSLAGGNFVRNAGDEFECSSETASRLIEKGFAVPVREQKIERAVKKQRGKEKAAK